MSAGQAPKRRSSSVIERSQYAPNRQPQADDRRHNLDALGQDRAANERAKREMAEMAQQQRGRAIMPVQLDDLEVQQRKPMRMVTAPAPSLDPAPDTDAPSPSNADNTALPAPQVSAVADQAILPPAVATTKQIRAKTVQQPAAVSAKQSRANAPASATRTWFECVEQQATHSHAPARSMPKGYPTAYPRDERYAPQEVYHYWEGPIALARTYPLVLMLLVALVSVPVILMLLKSPKTTISSYRGGEFVDLFGNAVNSLFSNTQNVMGSVPAGEHSVLGKPSISADDVDAILAQYKSPAQGTGKIWIELGEKYDINPAYALAFFIHESSAGTNPRWDGMKPDGSTTHNIGNISCAGYPRCLGRWRDYGSWEEGIEDWYRVIHDEYIQGRGIQTVEQIMPIYAPSFENDVDNYIQTVVILVDGWRRQGVTQ